MMDVFFEDAEFFGLSAELFEDFLELDAFRGRPFLAERVELFLTLVDRRPISGLQLVDVIGADAREEVGRVAVQIDQAFEPVLLAAVEEPVDRAFLIYFQVRFLMPYLLILTLKYLQILRC